MTGRPRSFDRERALNTAVESFWRDGYEATTVAGLTQAMGITPPSLYAAFGDKDRLFAEAVDCYADRTTRGIQRALDQPTTVAGLTELLEITARYHTEPGTPRGCLVLTEPRLTEQREAMRRQIAARIERGRAEGDVPAHVDPDGVAAYLVTTLMGMSSRARDGADAEEVLGTARMAAAAVQIAHLAPDPSSTGGAQQ